MTTEQKPSEMVETYVPSLEMARGERPFWSPSETARRAFFDDFLQVQTNIENPKRDSTNPHYGSNYVSLESLLTYLRPLLTGHGFTLFQTFGVEEHSQAQVFQTFLMHRDGAMLVSASPMPELGSPQQVVSYSTYMRRVQLSALLGIRDESDDDGNAASASQAQAPWMAQPSPAPAPAPAPAQMPQTPPSQAQSTPWQQQPAQAPMQQQPAPVSMPPQAPPQQPVPQQQQPVAPAPPAQPAPPVQAPVAAAPEGAIQGDTLQEAQNMIAAVRNLWGDQTVADILGRAEIPDISHMKHEDYAPFAAQMDTFVTANNKSMSMLGPESGNQVLIQ